MSTNQEMEHVKRDAAGSSPDTVEDVIDQLREALLTEVWTLGRSEDIRAKLAALEAEHNRVRQAQASEIEQLKKKKDAREQQPCVICHWPRPMDIEHNICECCGFQPGYDDPESYQWDGQFWVYRDHHTAELHTKPKLVAALEARAESAEAERDQARQEIKQLKRWNADKTLEMSRLEIERGQLYGKAESAEARLREAEQRIEELEVTEVSMNIDKTKTGLYKKFIVHRADRSDVLPGQKHYGCSYFVLDVTHDKHAPAALMAYADSCESAYPLLARDLRVQAAAIVEQRAVIPPASPASTDAGSDAQPKASGAFDLEGSTTT